jgi:hypothetical protein
MEEKKTFWAWFSPSQMKITGTVIYRGFNNEEIECTMISETPDHGTMWKYIRCIGLATEYLRKGQSGEFPIIDNFDDDYQNLEEEEVSIQSPNSNKNWN